MMTEGLANELWQKGIEVNSLIPGPTATATFDNAKPGEERSPEEILSAGPDALPKGLPAWERVKHPDEVAQDGSANGKLSNRWSDRPGLFSCSAPDVRLQFRPRATRTRRNGLLALKN